MRIPIRLSKVKFALAFAIGFLPPLAVTPIDWRVAIILALYGGCTNLYSLLTDPRHQTEADHRGRVLSHAGLQGRAEPDQTILSQTNHG